MPSLPSANARLWPAGGWLLGADWIARIMHLPRGETATIVVDLVCLTMAAFVAWGRFGPGSFAG